MDTLPVMTAEERRAELDRLRREDPELLRMAANAIVRTGMRMLREDAIRREQAERDEAAA